MAKKAKKAKKKTKGRGKGLTAAASNAFYFFIKCDLNGLIVGASSPDEDLDATVKKVAHVKLDDSSGDVVVKEIKFQKPDEFGPCVWKKIGGQWKCI